MTAIVESPVYLHERVIMNPTFYENTYWGGFRAGNCLDTEDVILARTSFMLDSKSSRVPTKQEYTFIRSYYQQFGLDHLEYYRGKDGKKYQVCSQHPGSLNLTSYQMEDEGWRKIDSMYQSSQDTYVRIYDQEREKYDKIYVIFYQIFLSIVRCYMQPRNHFPKMNGNRVIGG